ncbi:xylulokinase [Collibacillus ludicampi]|uniref:Xylulose kinase n=1 Tax=Collibacillus ludicampi TaxID=2771369 RepID=A0AAV4LFZ0_9BACL|nr:xylulokinase [Collibacillus ludicampi]GIM46727.1 xylulokinase [Collibacillus ludicampi]
MDTLLGIDLGSSSIKLILVDRHGKVVDATAKEYVIHSRSMGWAEQNPEDWLAALKEGIEELRSHHPEWISHLKGIGITGQMHGLVPVGQDGKPVSYAMIWADRRCEEEVQELENRIPLETWVEITGSRPHVSFTLPKILWMRRNQPDLFAKTSYYLLPKDYIRYVLTGIFATDVTDASATLMFDIKKRQWSQTILQSFDLDVQKLPKTYPSISQVGRLTVSAAEWLGLNPGIPVICGAGDAEAQAIGNGVVNPGTWLCTIGTGGQIFTPVTTEVTDRQGRIHTFCHGVEGVWHLMGATLSAGMSLQWIARHILNLEGQDAYGELMKLVQSVSPGSKGLIYLPYLFGERTPYMDNKAKGAFIGLGFHHTRKEMVRAVLEGVLFSLRQSIDVIQEIGISPPASMILTGGAAESSIWRQMAADIFGIPVSRCTSRSGSAYGAVILAAVGLGWFPDVQSAADSWIHITDTTYPDRAVHQRYQSFYSIFRESYRDLRNTFLKIDALMND